MAMLAQHTGRMWEVEVGKIIARIVARRDSDMFRDPVPYEEMGLIDYLDVVGTPMDLGTVRAKLDAHDYQSEDECAEDIRLIWLNAMLYNAPGAVVYVRAKTLSDFFEQQWGSYRNHDNNRPPGPDDLKMFAEMCYKVSAEDMGKILRLLEKDSPGCLVKKPNSNEVEINVDLIKGRVFRNINEYVLALCEEM